MPGKGQIASWVRAAQTGDEIVFAELVRLYQYTAVIAAFLEITNLFLASA